MFPPVWKGGAGHAAGARHGSRGCSRWYLGLCLCEMVVLFVTVRFVLGMILGIHVEEGSALVWEAGGGGRGAGSLQALRLNQLVFSPSSYSSFLLGESINGYRREPGKTKLW